MIGVIAGLNSLGAGSALAQDAEQKTVEGLYKDKAKHGGHEVQVRGKAVKVNNGVMNRNFLLIQDGTGKLGANDVTVTSQETANIGDEGVITVNVAVDKVFGSGFTYAILIEEAMFAKAKP